MIYFLLLALVLIGMAGFWLIRKIRRRGLHRWLGTYIRQTPKRGCPDPDREVHLLLCFADHFEPKWNQPPEEIAAARVEKWVNLFPQNFSRFKDSDGRPPRYTFFYPLEEYEPAYLDALAELCRAGFGEVEVHLHHDSDTAENLREQLLRFKELFARRHQLLARRRTGDTVFGFIHGNWALCNSGPDGRNCGVNNELEILRQTGCYADFTFPSAPHPTQPPIINSIYYASDRPGCSRSHESGQPAGRGVPPADSLLLIQGPLALDWSNRKWGLVPRLENGCLQASQPPDIRRLDNWLRARVQVPTRPDWFFVKLHAHGAPEESHQALLGEPMIRFHEALARKARENPNFHFHYLTAREMYNLVKAAEAGWQGTVADARDYELLWNGDTPILDPETRARTCEV